MDLSSHQSRESLEPEARPSESETLLEARESEVALKQPLSVTEKKNLVWLCFLYLLQAVPLGFAALTMPVLLGQRLSYGVVGSFSIAEYPYSLKVAWSPLVDGLYFSRLGRRKSWLIPSLLCSGCLLFWLGIHQDGLVTGAAHGLAGNLYLLISVWFGLLMLGTTINIAVNGWALELLSHNNIHWAPTVFAGALSAGYFISFNLFLALSDQDGPLQTRPLSAFETHNFEVLTPMRFLTFWAIIFFGVAFLLAVIKREDQSSHTKVTLQKSYAVIWRIISLAPVRTLMLIHLITNVGFQTNDSVTVLQLIRNGFTHRDIAGLATVSFPCELGVQILIGRLFARIHPLRVWLRIFPLRLLVAGFAQLCVFYVSSTRNSHWRWVVALMEYVLTKCMETAMFVSLFAFHARVADVRFGGVYMTMLATTTNLGIAIPRFFILKLISFLDDHKGSWFSPRSGSIDGYQVVNFCNILFAVPIFWFVICPAAARLQNVPGPLWRL